MEKKHRTGAGLALASVLFGATPALGEFRLDSDGLTGDFGDVQLRGRLSASVQASSFSSAEDPTAGTDTDTAIDGSVRLSMRYTADNAWRFGIVADFDSVEQSIERLERDEFYVYAVSESGRIEFGENDGPADSLSFHAPVIGIGQLRGDFSRYTGSGALVSPYDSRDSIKVTYLSPPGEGLRFGISYSPQFDINADDANPTQRRVQNDVIEIGARYVQPVGTVIVGVSAAYVTGTSDPVTGRGDIDSWSTGLEIRRGNLRAGAAFVSRGRSNLPLDAPEENGWNAGLRWQLDRWTMAASFADSEEEGGTVTRSGAGVKYSLTENAYVAGDLVVFEEVSASNQTRDGTVVLLETGLRF